MAVSNRAKNEAMRKKVVFTGKSEEVVEKLREDPYNEDLWYHYGMAISNEKGQEEGIDAFFQGIYYNPFSALLHFGRGRKNIGLKRYWRCIADETEAIRLQPELWNYWY